jgi:hypothetical protein
MYQVAIIHCDNPGVAQDIFEMYIEKGYAVGMSTVEIETGTHGKHVVKKLDILAKEDIVK